MNFCYVSRYVTLSHCSFGLWLDLWRLDGQTLSCDSVYIRSFQVFLSHDSTNNPIRGLVTGTRSNKCQKYWGYVFVLEDLFPPRFFFFYSLPLGYFYRSLSKTLRYFSYHAALHLVCTKTSGNSINKSVVFGMRDCQSNILKQLLQLNWV